uniref:Uncharacterized protein n=1 Tax=Sinocyclocheilus rhinocerous TaxID=307959 RepID=A0A673L851_9TELE
YLNAVRLCLPMPCPVLLGTVKGGGLSALLHRYTIEKKVAKVEKVLKKEPECKSREKYVLKLYSVLQPLV